MLACHQVYSWSWVDTNFEELELVLYTSGSNAMNFKIDEDNLSQKFLNHGFDKNKATKLFAHGFQDRGTRFCADFISAYASSGWDVNLICIDWQEYSDADQWLYIRASNNAIKIGAKIGQKIISDLLIEKLNQNPNLIHSIGTVFKNHPKEDHGLYSSVDPSYAVSRGLKILTTLFAWT